MMPPVAKTEMFNAGIFNGMDVIVRSHSVNSSSRPAPGFGTCCLNIDGVKYTFSGAPAHQMTPWAGRNALEAVIHLFNNIDAARTTMRPEARIQGVITEGGAAPNVVPDRTQADFYIRYPDAIYLAQVREAVDNSARAAALATGTKVKIDNYGKARDGISVATLAEATGIRRNRHRIERHSRPGVPVLHFQCSQPYLRYGVGRPDPGRPSGLCGGRPGDDRAALRFRHSRRLPRRGKA
jgi:metal-dependent amidase/aminoacylase/carboxypeptidase family protein